MRINHFSIYSIAAHFALLSITTGCRERPPPIDGDGNIYQTVVIGKQEWMAENLRTTKYTNGTEIPTGLSYSEWENTESGAYSIYYPDSIYGFGSQEEVLKAYGALYNWHAVETENLCPDGWRVPTDEDWSQLINYLINNYNDITSANVGNALKSCRQMNSPLEGECSTPEHPRWNQHDNHYGTDNFGFCALPGGYRSLGGHLGGVDYYSVGYSGSWWSAAEDSDVLSGARIIEYGNGSVFRLGCVKMAGLSVRCIRAD